MDFSYVLGMTLELVHLSALPANGRREQREIRVQCSPLSAIWSLKRKEEVQINRVRRVGQS